MREFSEILKDKQLMVTRHSSDGCMGYILCGSKRLAFVFSFGGGWEHLSVSMANITPSWDEMCFAKNIFWKPSECCVQYHPAEDNYVNVHEHCLHIWRPIDVTLPTPPRIFV